MTENDGVYQNQKQTSLENEKVEPVESVQINIYQSNTYGKDFENESVVQERQQVKDHCQKEDVKSAHMEKRVKNDKTEISGLIFMLKT